MAWPPLKVPVAFKAAPPNFARVIPPQASTGAAVTPRQVAATEKKGRLALAAGSCAELFEDVWESHGHG
eukprot:g24825.t1